MAALTRDAITALCREIGIADTLRFLHQLRPGRGDYAREPEELLGERKPTLEEILSEIRGGEEGGGAP